MSCRPQQLTILFSKTNTRVSHCHLAVCTARESLDSRRGSRFGALSPDTRRLFAGRAVVRAAPLISRRSSSTDFPRRRSRTKTAFAEPPVTVRLDFHDPGYLSSRSHDGLRRLVTRAPETQLTFRARSRSTVVRAGARPATLGASLTDGCDSIDSPRSDSVLDFCCHATRGRIREQWSSSSMRPLFFLRLFAGEGARRRAVFRLFAKRKRPAESPQRMAIPLTEMTEPQRLSRRTPVVVTPAPTQGESLDRFDRPDQGLDLRQLATAASSRDPACSIKSDFGAELSLAHLPSALLSRTWRGRPPLFSG